MRLLPVMLGAACAGAGLSAGILGSGPLRWVSIGCALIAGAATLVAARAVPTVPTPSPVQPAGEDSGPERRAELLAGLAAGVAHELGQPLSAARVGIEGIHYLRQIGREPSPEHLSRTLSRVGMSLLAMTQTIEHLRTLARQDGSSPRTSIDLADLVDGLLAERDQWLRFRDTRIEWRRPEGPVPALADAAGVRLIVTNLLRNAVEAVEGQSAERRLVRLSVGPGPKVVVHDSGPGIPPELAQTIFDPFRSSKGPGRGIGLSLAKASAERMGGTLSVESAPGSGSRFVLSLFDGPAA